MNWEWVSLVFPSCPFCLGNILPPTFFPYLNFSSQMLGTTCLPFKLCWKDPQITSSLPFLSYAPLSLYAIFWSLLELILSPELECKLPKEHFSDLHLWNIYLNFLYTFTFMSNTVFSIWEVPNNICWLFAIKEYLRILLKAIFLFNLFRSKKK